MIDVIYKLGDSRFKSKTIEELYKEVLKQSTVNGFSPEVTIHGDMIRVHADDKELSKDYQELAWIMDLCQLSKFDDAEPRLYRLLKKHPYNSEAYRILAQIYQLRGEATRALDLLLDALRWDPKNVGALLLMGNILAGEFNDPRSALTYFRQVCDIDSDNVTAISNIGSTYSRLKEYDTAADWYLKALQKDDSLENIYYNLAADKYRQNDFNGAFEWTRLGLIHGIPKPENPGITDYLKRMMVESCSQIDENQYINAYNKLKETLERDNSTKIVSEQDDSLDVYAQFRYGPLRGEVYHKIVYNPNHLYLPHILVHELVHYEMMSNLEREGNDWMVVSMTVDNELEFAHEYQKWYQHLMDAFGIEKAKEIVENVQRILFLQVVSCPLDLFVEQRIFTHYKDMRPIQQQSMLFEERDNIKKYSDIVEPGYLPDSILRAIRIMNVTSSMQYEKLYGLHLYDEYNASEDEMKVARDFYEKFEEYISADGSYTPGDEYDFMRYIINKLGFSRFLTLTPHTEYLKQEEGLEESMNPLYVNSSEGGREESAEDAALRQTWQDNFYEKNKDGEDPEQTKMMMSYMYEALKTFHNQSNAFIGRVACEIAQIGVAGIIPQKDGYVVTSLENRGMNGYQLLAYYYVSWKLFNEEMHKMLKLPFDTAWRMAKNLFDIFYSE